MSDPLKSADIEDVLSSIRRLVSEDSRARPETPPRPQGDRLVLTPALRVPESRPDIAPGDEVSDDLPEAETGQPDPGDGETSPSGDLPEHEPQLADDIAEPDDDVTDAVDAPQEAECGVREPEDEDLAEAPDEAQVQAAQAAIDSMVEQAVRDATAEALADHDQDTPEEPAMAWEDHDAEKPDPEDTAQTDESAEDTAPEATDPAEAPSDDTQDAAGPQGWGGTLYEAAARSGAETEEPAAAAFKSQRHDPAPDFDFLASDDAVLDEEALRELVADIVRQELQGALGERITRNVRKLVRREIHRALSAQDFD